MRLLFILILWSISFGVMAQNLDSLNQKAAPIGGIDRLSLIYYRIDFTKAQRVELSENPLEFIYLIDELGKPSLEDINGVKNPDILDSLYSASKNTPPFSPRIVKGEAVGCTYFLQLTFPTYKVGRLEFDKSNLAQFRSAKLEDFEFVKLSGRKIDLTTGIPINFLVGNVSDYLKVGAGIRQNLVFIPNSKIGFGLSISASMNRKKQDYPNLGGIVQSENTSNLALGLLVRRYLNINEQYNSKLSIQLELNYLIHDVTLGTDINSPNYLRLSGFSPTITINYPIQVGKASFNFLYDSPIVMKNHINFNASIRPLFLNLKEASGIAIQFGVSWNFSFSMIEDYELKPNEK